MLVGETSDVPCQVFEVRLEKKVCYIEDGKYSKTNTFVLQKNVRYIKCALYQMYAKLTKKNSNFVRKSGKRALYWSVRYIKGLLY